MWRLRVVFGGNTAAHRWVSVWRPFCLYVFAQVSFPISSTGGTGLVNDEGGVSIDRFPRVDARHSGAAHGCKARIDHSSNPTARNFASRVLGETPSFSAARVLFHLDSRRAPSRTTRSTWAGAR